MMGYHKVPADRYEEAKKHHEDMVKEMGMDMPFEAVPVDLYGGFVPMEKEGTENLKKTLKCNSERFGIEEVLEDV